MERIAWTDERLDDLANRMDAGFARVDADIRELRADIGGLRLTLLRVGGGIMICHGKLLLCPRLRGFTVGGAAPCSAAQRSLVWSVRAWTRGHRQ